MTKQLKTVKLNDIVPYENNPRHNDQAVDAVKESIKQCEYIAPIIVDEDMVILAGHTRHKALKSLGKEEAEVMIVTGLTDEQKRKYRLLDNKTNELATWDIDLLELELDDLDFGDFDFGFDVEQIEPEPEVEEDDYTEENVETRCKLGDLWQLGDHRLICGDSTDVNVIERLMDGCRADISFTSPPYNAGHMDVSKSAERGGGLDKSTMKKYIGDDDQKTDDEYFDFISSIMDILLTNSDEVFFNIGIGSGSKKTICRLIYQYADYFKDLIYWQKDNPVPCIVESVISSAVELIICFGENGSRSFNHFNDRMFHGVINGHSASGSNKYADIHKATFPVYLPSEVIQRFTDINGTVFDCFGGTGTTMIACEQLNRKCYMSELEPIYCDVIIDRWEQYTGKKAVLINE